jgi:hypothetical protein
VPAVPEWVRLPVQELVRLPAPHPSQTRPPAHRQEPAGLAAPYRHPTPVDPTRQVPHRDQPARILVRRGAATFA